MKNFWKKLPKIFFCLAPMTDVTDCVFRQIITKYGKPDVLWTEFVSADGLIHPLARKKLLIDLKYSKKEHPIVAQIFGSNIENIKKAAALCQKLGFDGIDINMGCPDKSIEKQKAGAAMMKDPLHAIQVIRAAKEGWNKEKRKKGNTANSLISAVGSPISVKTRIGYNKNERETWIPILLKENIAALTVHLRTRKEMSLVPAHWELMKRIVEIRDEMKVETLIIGNGDVADTDDGRKKCEETGCDGVMLGRAIFGNPFLFTNKNVLSEVEGHVRVPQSGKVKRKNSKFLQVLGFPHEYARPDHSEILVLSFYKKLKLLVEHTKLFEKKLGGKKNFAIMKKHYKAYVNGFEGAKELRIKLMETKNAKEVEKIIKDFLLYKKDI